jgi:excisionase family DNA binding protein
MSTLTAMSAPHEHDPAEAFVGIVEGARIARVSENTLRRWADSGRIPVYRTPGNQRRFKVSELRAHLIQPERPAQASA